MKKRERIQSVNSALMRATMKVATKDSLATEIAANATGTVTPAEAQKLVELGKWTPEVMQAATDLGLVVETAKKERAGGGGAGGVQKVFAEKYPDLYKGKRVPTDKDIVLVDELVGEFGVRPILARVREIVATKTEYKVGQYFFKEEPKPAKPPKPAKSPKAAKQAASDVPQGGQAPPKK